MSADDRHVWSVIADAFDRMHARLTDQRYAFGALIAGLLIVLAVVLALANTISLAALLAIVGAVVIVVALAFLSPGDLPTIGNVTNADDGADVRQAAEPYALRMTNHGFFLGPDDDLIDPKSRTPEQWTSNDRRVASELVLALERRPVDDRLITVEATLATADRATYVEANPEHLLQLERTLADLSEALVAYLQRRVTYKESPRVDWLRDGVIELKMLSFGRFARSEKERTLWVGPPDRRPHVPIWVQAETLDDLQRNVDFNGVSRGLSGDPPRRLSDDRPERIGFMWPWTVWAAVVPAVVYNLVETAPRRLAAQGVDVTDWVFTTRAPSS